jgi:hypothetical protein
VKLGVVGAPSIFPYFDLGNPEPTGGEESRTQVARVSGEISSEMYSALFLPDSELRY